MSLAGIGFVFFLPGVWLIHWLLPRRTTWQNAWLLLASYAFYATWDSKLLPLLWASTLFDYVIGRRLSSVEEPRHRKHLLWTSIALNLGILGVFKYLGFFEESLNTLLHGIGISSSLPILKLALPLGISYITLIKVGHILDVYYERIEAESSLLRYALFLAFFPHLIAGPIVRGKEVLHQYAQPRVLLPENMQRGMGHLFLGFFMKAYVAELLARWYVTPTFKHPGDYSILSHWVGLFGYAGQLFCDFAGYSLMAIGVGLLFGIQLPENFRYPFLSTSMMDFWRRWHITLNRWLFDYLFYPMTTGQGRMRGQISLGFLLVFALSGLWHGPLWTFVLWGVLHGVGLIVQHRWDLFYKGLCRKDRSYVKLRKSRKYKLTAWFITQLFFLLTLIPFHATSLAHAWEYTRGLFVTTGTGQHNLVSINLLVCSLFLVAYHLGEFPIGETCRERWRRTPAPVRGMCYGLIIVFLALFMPVGMGSFIYANF
ncbi:MAG: MBOAT family protein [Deltaproteobacteria bacterium]|nr:MAG: MBOAT family protein [Deltaproteobacteria bacterium]